MNPVHFCEPQEAEEKYLSHYAFRGECREKYVCCTQISLWWSVNYDKSNR